MVRRFSKVLLLAAMTTSGFATSSCANTTSHAQATAKLQSLRAERDAAGTYTLSWAPVAADATVEVTGGSSPDAIDHQTILARVVGGTSVTVPGLDGRRRWYFEVAERGGAATLVGERHLKLTGATNYRDLGGYPSSDGRVVRWGAVYRSDHLGKIDGRDIDYLTGIGVKLAFDFRVDKEVQKSPDAIADGSRIAYERGPILLPIDPQATLDSGTTIDEAFLTKVYTDILDTNAALFVQLFSKLGDAGTRPMVFHCTGGKDRAGIASALLLSFLGVPDDVVARDYALSDTYNAQVIEAQERALRDKGYDPAKLGVALKSPPAVILGMLAHVRGKYGSVDAYLASGGLDDTARAKLRTALLVDGNHRH